MPLLAKTKPEVTLLDHSIETLKHAREIATNYGFDKATRLAIEIASAFHDIGKADSIFQDKLRESQTNSGRVRLPPHALLGLPVIQKIVRANISEPVDSLILLAAASHHSPLSAKLYESYDASLELDPVSDGDFKDTTIRLCKELGIDDARSYLSPFDLPKKVLVRAKDHVVNWRPSSSKAGREKREKFVAIQGVLQQADWLTSSGSTLARLTFPEVIHPQPWPYQTKAAQIKGNLFITLPTGTGKTETSLYWAAANSTPQQRVFYILPTITTINNMFLRLQNLWKTPRAVAFYHSYIDLFFDLDGGEADSSYQANDSTLQFFKYFFNPVNVTTPDQLILALLNHKRYTLKSLPFRKATFIMDEIHCYDPETFALIKGMIKYLSNKYDAKFCVMSATFPKAVKRELGFLKATNLLNESETRNMYKTRHRTSLECGNGKLEENLDFVEQTKGSVLIVLNTVKMAQETYRRIKPLLQDPNEIMLLHSRYTFRDRRSKEARLTDASQLPRILVATQIVEVSLDIDYDQMLTHSCDPLSLVQRAGRVNRRGRRNTPAAIRVFDPPTHHPYEKEVMSKAEDMLRDLSGKVTSELDYLDLADRFYSEIWPLLRNEEAEERYQEVWEKLRYIYSADLSDKEIQQLLQTRTGTISIPAIPIGFKHEIEEINRQLSQADSVKEKMKLYRRKRSYHVNVPITERTSLRLVKEDNDQYVKMEYDREYGLHL